LDLSVLITDNLGLDSNYTAMYQFAQADLLLQQHQFERAFQLFDSINAEFPTHSLSDDILLRKGEAYEYQGKWNEAIAMYSKILSVYADDILADNAVFKLAEIYEYRLNDTSKALEYYKKILFDFKGSVLSESARKKVRQLRGDGIE
jgi:tetratricopeptide (TPR) repeat protein